MTVNKQLTLLLLHCGEKVLLGLKRRGFGAGKVCSPRAWPVVE